MLRHIFCFISSTGQQPVLINTFDYFGEMVIASRHTHQSEKREFVSFTIALLEKKSSKTPMVRTLSVTIRPCGEHNILTSYRNDRLKVKGISEAYW